MSYWFQTRWFLCEFPIGSYVKLSSAVQPSWSEGGTTRHNFERGPSNDYFIKGWFQLSNWFQTRRFLCEFPIGSYVQLSSAVWAILVEGPDRQTYFWKRTIQWLFHQNLVLIEQMVSDEDFLWEFPIGSYVKLSLAVVAILVGGLKCRIQFWKGTTQESSQQSLVEIGSIVSEEKIFFLFHPPFFSDLHNRSKSTKVQSS